MNEQNKDLYITINGEKIKIDPISDLTLNRNIKFYNSDDYKLYFYNNKNIEIGSLDFSENELKFSGNADEAAQLFIKYLVHHLSHKINEKNEDTKRLDYVIWHGLPKTNQGKYQSEVEGGFRDDSYEDFMREEIDKVRGKVL